MQNQKSKMGLGWYYTLVFIFSILVTLKLIVEVIINFMSENPTKLRFSHYELIFYGISFSYLLTYIIT